MKLDRIRAHPKSGAESLHANGKPLPFTLLDFWRWSTSDLVSNVTRGRLAEFIVATALGIPVSGVRDEWSAWDLTTPEGVRVEVKSAAFVQSWHQQHSSIISFRVPKTRAWDADTSRQATLAQRQAQVYVFAVLAHPEKPTIDPLDIEQWEFWVAPTASLDSRKRSQHSITIPSLAKLCGNCVRYTELRSVVLRAAGHQAV